MEDKPLSREQFVRDFSPLVKKTASIVLKKYWIGFKDPKEELKDFVQTGMMELVSIFERVDFMDPGFKGYISQRVHGCLVNYALRNIPGTTGNGPSSHGGMGGPRPSRRKEFLAVVSLEELLDAGHEFTQEDETELLLFRVEVADLMGEFMAGLAPLDRLMLVARYHDRRTYEQIGTAFHLQRATVARRIGVVLDRLGGFLRERRGWRLEPSQLDEYLEETELRMVIGE